MAHLVFLDYRLEHVHLLLLVLTDHGHALRLVPLRLVVIILILIIFVVIVLVAAARLVALVDDDLGALQADVAVELVERERVEVVERVLARAFLEDAAVAVWGKDVRSARKGRSGRTSSTGLE